MVSRRVIFTFIIAALSLSCSLPFFANQAEGPQGVQPEIPSGGADTTQAPQAAPPTDTVSPLPTETATITLTPTPGVPMVTPIDQAVNCRFGPGTEYEAQGSGLAIGNSAQILGKSENGDWWQIQDPSSPNEKCWVAASVTNASGNLSGVAVVPAPAAFVTDVTAKTSPDHVNLPGCMGPVPSIAFKGTITVNGPAKVKWHFETSAGGPLVTHTTNFSKYSSQNVEDSFGPSPTEGDYWVRLIITSPNDMVGETSFKINCP
jgi:hypothetical protein